MRTSSGALRRAGCAFGLGLALFAAAAPNASAQLPTTNDPRVGLGAGFENATTASRGVELLAHLGKPPGFSNPANPGDITVAFSDMAFQGNYAFIGSFNGFNVYDIANPAAPVHKTSVICPGGQGDVSVYGNLLFMSVEETRAKTDCTLTPAADATTRFRGVRIFDISDINAPRQVGGVQTCRGSHTHTLVEGKDSPDTVYIYVSGTSGTIRPATELAGCNAGGPETVNPSQWRIEVIRVPLANPAAAAVVSEPRLMRNEQTGAVNGLQNAPQTPNHPSGTAWGPVPDSNSCHDITVFEELNIGAGACEGNGLLLDISDPANPKRIDAVADPLFAYWHGATFSNDGSTVMFTDEWGGGTAPRCRATDQLSWGANAIYEIVNNKLVFRSYYKIPPVQTDQENCVSHIPSIVPVQGRDIFVQAWYQGGMSVVDFTNPAAPKEIGFFDRGPITAGTLTLGGFWSAYWYNGAFYGSEIARGFDAFKLTPTNDLSAAELRNAANAKPMPRLNAQTQQSYQWLRTDTGGGVSGTVPATLALTLGAPGAFGAFTPGVARDYTATTMANVISTAGDAALSVADPSSNAPGRLVNGAFSLITPVQAMAASAGGAAAAGGAVSGSPLSLLNYSGPISNDGVTLTFKQSIAANEPLRTGSYSKTLTFTLSTTTP